MSPYEEFVRSLENPLLEPTLALVRRRLETGELEGVRHHHGQQKLIAQWFDLAPLLHRHLPDFAAAGLPLGESDLRLGFRLVELLSEPMAERASLNAALKELTRRQSEVVRELRRIRGDLLRLARDRKVPEGLFRVRLGEGDAAKVLSGARVLVEMIERHGEALGASRSVGFLLEGTKSALDELQRLELSQESVKLERTLPTALLASARAALYALLLRVSRLGPVALVEAAPEARARFALTHFRSRRPSMKGLAQELEG